MIARPNEHADGDDTVSPLDPTPQQIRERSQAIRSRWSKKTRARRRVGTGPTWSPPILSLTEFRLAVSFLSATKTNLSE